MTASPIGAVLEALGRDSRMRQPGASAISFLMDLMYFGDFSILEQVSSGETDDRVNIIGKKGPAKGTPLVLVSTVSTSVEPIPARWSMLGGDGLAARRSDDGKRLFGLGANGGKVDAVLKILAGSQIDAESFVRPLYIIAISGEEAHGSGVRAALELLEGEKGSVVVHAPTSLSLWTDHPGCIGLRLEITRRTRHRRMPPHAGLFELRLDGRSSHAHAAPDGLAHTNALARALKLLDQLRAHGEVKVLSFQAGETANRVPGRCVMQIATSYAHLPRLDPDIAVVSLSEDAALPLPIDALFSAWFDARDAGLAAISPRLGELRNAALARPPVASWTGRVASNRDAFEGSVMFWTGPGVTTSDLCERFAEGVQRALVGQEELEVQIEVIQDRPAFAGSEDNDLLELARLALRRSGLPTDVSSGTFTTDAGLFRTRGMNVVCFGPGGPLSRLYQDDESIEVSRLEAAARFYEQLIRAYCVEGR